MASDDSTTTNQAAPHRLGLISLICLVIANMIGAGLYTTSGFALHSLGRADLVLVVWAIAGVMALCGAISYGALARRIPLSGGEYLYLSRLIDPSVGFLAGWISLIAGFTAPIAAAAETFSVYIVPRDLASEWNINVVASLAILIGAILHACGLKGGALAQNATVGFKLVGLSAILVYAAWIAPSFEWQSGVLEVSPSRGSESVLSSDVTMIGVVGAMLGSLVWISLSYTGFNAAVYVAGESRDANNIVPKAMVGATLIVTFIYIAFNALFLYSAPPSTIDNQQQIATISMTALGGANLSGLMTFVIVLSSLTSVLSMLMTGPRVYSQMAHDGYLPTLFAPGKTVPRWAILIQAILSIVVVLAADLRELIGYLGLTLTACGAIAVASVWRIRRVYPEQPALSVIESLSSVVFIMLTLAMLGASAWVKTVEFSAMITTVLSGVMVYAITRWIKIKPSRLVR